MLKPVQRPDFRSKLASPSTRKHVIGKQGDYLKARVTSQTTSAGDQLKALLASKQKAAKAAAVPTPLTDPLALIKAAQLKPMSYQQFRKATTTKGK
jgi:hypothetical protein